MRPRSIIAGCVVLLFLVVFIPDMSGAAGNVINGCVSKSRGAVRVVTPPAHCSRSETPISWNITGPQGPQGPAGVTAGIRAAVWGQLSVQNCSVPFFRGADAISGVATGNGAECKVTVTLPAGQPQTWGTAYACYTSIMSGNGTSFDTTCQYSGGMNAAGKPEIIFACRNGAGQASATNDQISFLCIAP
jgi:hypothetical protein